MITDDLDHWEIYRPLHPGISAALHYLSRTNFEHIGDGRHELVTDQLYAMTQHYLTKRPAETVWESHRRFIDVQYVAEGAERLGHVPATSRPPVKVPYDTERDIEFYSVNHDAITLTALTKGHFAIFYPQDIHAPGLAFSSEPAPVHKVVVKVAVDWR